MLHLLLLAATAHALYLPHLEGGSPPDPLTPVSETDAAQLDMPRALAVVAVGVLVALILILLLYA
jgi:hypothetical protein